MSLLLIAGGGLALLLLIWAVCRTPSGARSQAEADRAAQTAQKSQMEAIFGDEGDS